MVDEHSNFKPFRMFYFSSDVLSMASPMTTTTMATATVDDMSLMGRVAVLLGSEENALRILLSLLLGMSFLLPQVVYLGAYFHRKALMLHDFRFLKDFRFLNMADVISEISDNIA